MADETVEVGFDADLATWTIDGGPAGPAGVASWEAAGVYWAVDRVSPERLVRCEVDASVGARGRALVELLVGDVLAEGAHRLGGSPVVRQSAGWLAVALDELEEDDGPSLLQADAFLLARRVGIDDLLPHLDLDAVEAAVDALDPTFLDHLQADFPADFNLLRSYQALLRADGRGVPSLDLSSTKSAAMLTFAGGDHEVHVWCGGVGLGAVVDATARLVRGRRRIVVDITVGDRPADDLYVQTLRDLDVVGTARGEPTDRPGCFRAELDWSRAGAQAVRVVRDLAEPPPSLHWATEAAHWGREAARQARRDATVAGHLWRRAADCWQEAGETTLAEQAETRIGEAAQSPFLRDRATSWRLEPRPELADTAQLLGLVHLTAQARLASAEALLAEGRTTAALVEAMRARRDFRRLARPTDADRAAEVAEAAQP